MNEYASNRSADPSAAQAVDALNSPVSDPTGDCPKPLIWQDVVEAFRSTARPWEVNSGGWRLRGRTWGDGSPLYFLNGLAGDCELFALCGWLLRETHRCVFFDYPVAGDRLDDSPTCARPLTISELVRHLVAAADLHQDSRFQVFASSFGTAVALSAMLERPQRISNAILECGFARRRLSSAERLLIRVCLQSARRASEFPLRGWIQEQNHCRWFPRFDDSRWRFYTENTGRVPVHELARRAAALRDFDLRSRLNEIRQPVMLVRSEGDGAVAAACQDELESGLTNAVSETIDSCGQLAFLTHPHRLAKLIRDAGNL